MSELKLAKLPDRKPVKIAITISPNLNKKLDAYADAYKGAYGDEEKVSDLIPFMLIGSTQGMSMTPVRNH